MNDTTRSTVEVDDLHLSLNEVRDAIRAVAGGESEDLPTAYFQCFRCEGCFRCFRCEGCHRCEGCFRCEGCH